MTERIITVEPYDPRYKDAALKLREILAGVLRQFIISAVQQCQTND